MRKSVRSKAYVVLQTLLVGSRKRARLTQQEVADQLDRPQSFVAKYEGGERRLDVVELIAVGRAIGADPNGFLTKLIAEAGLREQRTFHPSRTSRNVRAKSSFR